MESVNRSSLGWRQEDQSSIGHGLESLSQSGQDPRCRPTGTRKGLKEIRKNYYGTTQTSQSLYQALWNSADVLRSKMDANDYKSYLLGMVFYKYLSDKMLFFVAETMEEGTDSLEDALEVYRNYYEDADTHEDLVSVMNNELNYIIKPDLTFTALVARDMRGLFQLRSGSRFS